MSKSKKTNVKMEQEVQTLSSDQILEIFTKTAKFHNRPIAIITMGIPGSGKSTIVKSIVENQLQKFYLIQKINSMILSIVTPMKYYLI